MFTLPDLPFPTSALEPYIDTTTMEIHHAKHHGAYVKNLNDALAGQENYLNMDVTELIYSLNKLPEEIRTIVRNNAGGHYNHSFFWKSLKAKGGAVPSERLLEAINNSFGDFEIFQEKFTSSALSRFGSGWVWLVINPSTSSGQNFFEILDSPNQDNPLMQSLPDGSRVKVSILGLDVWEHAYYLKYQNRRVDYIKAFWNIVNWAEVERRFNEV